MTRADLAAALDVSVRQVDRWIAGGLPGTKKGRRREFDPAAVRAWLIEHGLAEADAPTVETRDQVANYFGVHLRTVAAWLSAGCPGKSGRFDLAEIERWRKQTKPNTTAAEAVNRAELLAIKVDRERLARDRERGDMLPVDPLIRWAERYAAEIRARLEQLPDALVAGLPPKTPRRAVAAARKRLQATVDDCFQTIADSVADLVDQAETPES